MTTRHRALFIVAVLMLMAIVLSTFVVFTDTEVVRQAEKECSAEEIPVNLDLPADMSHVRIIVLNGTKTPGVAFQVAEDFRSREFNVLSEGNEGSDNSEVVAKILFGPRSVGAAWVVRAYFINAAELVFDPKREDDIITVVVGGKFKQLATATEKNQALAAAGHPTLPPGTCDISKK